MAYSAMLQHHSTLIRLAFQVNVGVRALPWKFGVR